MYEHLSRIWRYNCDVVNFRFRNAEYTAPHRKECRTAPCALLDVQRAIMWPSQAHNCRDAVRHSVACRALSCGASSVRPSMLNLPKSASVSLCRRFGDKTWTEIKSKVKYFAWLCKRTGKGSKWENFCCTTWVARARWLCHRRREIKEERTYCHAAFRSYSIFFLCSCNCADRPNKHLQFL